MKTTFDLEEMKTDKYISSIVYKLINFFFFFDKRHEAYEKQ